MKILFYGRLADLLGREVDLDAPQGSSIAEIRDLLAMALPRSAEVLAGRRILACVADSVVREDYMVGENDQVEFLPPVSGG